MATTTSPYFKTVFINGIQNFTFPGILYEPPIPNIIIKLDGDDYRITDGPTDEFKKEGGLIRTYTVESMDRW